MIKRDHFFKRGRREGEKISVPRLDLKSKQKLNFIRSERVDIYVIHSFQTGSPMVYHMIFIFEIRDTASQTNYGTADRETCGT